MWIPLALVSVFLFVAACLIFFNGQIVLSGLEKEPVATPTRVARLSTPTLVPTIVRQPTLPPATATPLPVIGKIIEPRVNVRAEPNTFAKILGKVIKEDMVTILGRSEDEAWYQVRLNDIAEPSWIFAETLEIASGDVTTLPIAK